MDCRGRRLDAPDGTHDTTNATHNAPGEKGIVGGGAHDAPTGTHDTPNGTHNAPGEKGAPMVPLNGHGRDTGEMGRRGAVPYGGNRTWWMGIGTRDTPIGPVTDMEKGAGEGTVP